MSDVAHRRLSDTSDAHERVAVPVGGQRSPTRQAPKRKGEPIARYVAATLELDLLTRVDDRYTPLFEVVDAGGQVVVQIRRSRAPFRAPLMAPTIVLIEDDADGALGPVGYDARSIQTCTRRCVGAVLVIGDRSPLLYQAAGEMVAGKRSRVLLIETRPERLDAWVRVLQATRPRLSIVVGPAPKGEVDG